MSPRTTARTSRSRSSRFRAPSGARRPGLYLAAAAAGAVMVGVVTGGEPPAQAEPMASVSIAEQLGISADAQAAPVQEQLAPLQQLAASRSERDAEQAAAAAAQQAADREAARKAAEEAARKEAARKAAAEEAAREEAARQAAEEEAAAEAAAAEAAEAEAAQSEAAEPAPAAAAAAAPSGSYQEYALSQLGGDSSEFSCLESLWGRESGWNPSAQNPTSSAYGIAQFLDSTWAGTGIAKTSDGYRQIDAGLIYINSRYGSPCGAWGHSQSTGWY